MECMVEGVGRRIASIGAHLEAAHEEIAALLAVVRGCEGADRLVGGVVLEAAELIGRSGQAHEGELIQLLAVADRCSVPRGGLVPWIATHLNLTQGAARGIAQSAREIGGRVELSEALSSGRVGGGTIRALTRAARAVKHTTQDSTVVLTETLELATNGSVGEARRHVRILEERVDPGHGEELLRKQRRRSFVRVLECESGMTRVEALLDPERATVVRAALDATVAAVLRARQYDHTELVPEDVVSIEQVQAHALTRFAEVYLAASPEQRGAGFTCPVLYTVAVDPGPEAGLAVSVYDQLIPRTRLASLQNSATHLLEHADGEPVHLDGEALDEDPAARLATPAQRVALAWRDKHCTYPGCDRPPSWSLHAHHKVAHSRQGPTAMRNLTLLCSEHHVLTHHPGAEPGGREAEAVP